MRKDGVWNVGPGGTYIQSGGTPLGYDLLINGISHYINFNTVVGVNGYGFRDNGGIIEFKDSGGTWTAVGTGGGGGTPGGLNTQLQYNNNGVFGGITGAVTDGTSVSLTTAHLLNPTINGAGTGLITLAYPNTTTSGTATFPAGTYAVVGDTLTQSISNKTITASSYNGVTLTTGGGTTTFLNANGTYTTPAGTNFWSRDAVNGYLFPLTLTDKVGIGTNTPSELFQIGDTTDGNFRFKQSGGNAGEMQLYYLTESVPRFALGRDMLGAGIDGFILKSTSTGTNVTAGVGFGSAAAGVLGVYTSNGTTLAEKARWDGSGNLGLLTNAPTHTLTLASTNTGIVSYNTSDQVTNYERVRMNWASSIFVIQSESAGTGTLRGITINGAATMLEVASDSAFGPAVVVRLDSTGSGFISAIASSQLTSSTATQNAFTIATKVLQTGSASYRGIWVTPWISSKGSGNALLMDLGTNTEVNASGTHTSKFKVSDNGDITINGAASVLTITDTGQTSPAGMFQIRSSSNTLQFFNGALGSSANEVLSLGGNANGFTTVSTLQVQALSGGVFTGTNVFNVSNTGAVLIGAGSASANTAPLKLTAGTNLTTAEAGAEEYDGKVFYSTPTASARGVDISQMFALVDTAFTMSNVTTAQPAFPPAYDVWTLNATTTYKFEGAYYMTHGSVSHAVQMGFALGGSASVTSITYNASVSPVVANSASTTTGNVWITTTTATTVEVANVQSGSLIRFTGYIRMNVGGTVTPQITFSADPTGTIQMNPNSYITFTPVGSNTVTAIGNVG